MGTQDLPNLPQDFARLMANLAVSSSDPRDRVDDDVEIIDLDGRRDDIRPTTWHLY